MSEKKIDSAKFGDRMKKARELRGYSVDQAANALEKSVVDYEAMEANKAAINTLDVTRFCRLMHIRIHDLFSMD